MRLLTFTARLTFVVVCNAVNAELCKMKEDLATLAGDLARLIHQLTAIAMRIEKLAKAQAAGK
jgi:hypothetical protein